MPGSSDRPSGPQRREISRVRGAAAWARVLPLLVAASLSGQPVSELGPGLTGELVRFPDAVVNVSVFAPDIGVVPAALWRRVTAAAVVRFHADGSPGANEVIRAQVAGLPGIGALREVEDPGETGPVGIGVTPKDQLRLDWNGVTEDEGVEILAAARAASEGFSLTIRIPNPTDTADWWGLQAALSQAGIRRVRILSGSPANASRDGP